MPLMVEDPKFKTFDEVTLNDPLVYAHVKAKVIEVQGREGVAHILLSDVDSIAMLQDIVIDMANRNIKVNAILSKILLNNDIKFY